MNLTQAQAELTARGDPSGSTSRQLVWLNEAKNVFEDHYAWPWLESTTTGTAPLTIADLKQILYVTDTTDKRILLPLDPREIVREDTGADVTMTGSPLFWWLDGTTTLKVWPVNATPTLSVRYVKFSPELASGTDTPLIPVRHHNVWIDLAMVQAYKDNDDYQAATTLEQLAETRLQGLVNIYAGRNLQAPDFQTITDASCDW